jgi:hypothetical protein
MDPLHAAYAPMLAAWMGGALLSLASAGLRHRVGLRTRAHAHVARRPALVRRTPALHR